MRSIALSVSIAPKLGMRSQIQNHATFPACFTPQAHEIWIATSERCSGDGKLQSTLTHPKHLRLTSHHRSVKEIIGIRFDSNQIPKTVNAQHRSCTWLTTTTNRSLQF